MTNINCMKLLDDELTFSLTLGGQLLHIRCAHVIYLYCQEDIEKFSSSKDSIRSIVNWVRTYKE